MVAARKIRRRLYNDPVTAVQIGELARDIQAQIDSLDSDVANISTGSLPPSGAAGGDLAATYPNPQVAAIHETSGPQKLTIGAIADGETLVRSGSTLVGSPGTPPGGLAGGDLATTYPNPQVAAIHETSGPTKLTIGAIVDGEVLIRSGATLVGTSSLSPNGPAGGDLDGTYPNPSVAALTETSGPTQLIIGAIADGEILIRAGSTVVGAAQVGGIWLPDAEPIAPDADDDEFLDGTGIVPSGWANFDPLALGLVAEELYPTFLKCEVPYNATNRLLATYRAAPAVAEYSVWTKFSSTMVTGSSGGADDWDMSFVLMEGTTTLTKWAGISLSYNSSIICRTWATYNATPVNVGPTDPMYVDQVVYVRIGYDAVNFYFYISDDGVGWNKIGEVAKTFTPSKVGFAFTNSKNTGTKYVLFDFYRVITGGGSSGTDILAGGRVTTSFVGVPPAGGNPTGPAGGDLTGTYPNPLIAPLAVTDAKTAAANKDGLVAVPSMRTLGTGALQSCAGNDSRLSDSRTPTGAAGGDLTGTYPNPTIALLAVTDAKVAVANKDGLAITPSMRTLGTTAVSACAGDDARLSDARPPTGTAGGDLAATYPNPEVAAIHETSGPTKLTIGAIANGEVLTRSGATLVSTPGTFPPNGAAGGDLAATYPNPQVAAIHETSGPTKLTIGSIPDGYYVKRSGAALIGITNTAAGDLAGTYPNPTVAAIHETSGPTKLTIGAIADGGYLKRSGATIVSDNTFVNVLKAGFNGFRLTGQSLTPIFTDITNVAITTIYLTPYKSNLISLYNGSTWDLYSSAEVSLAVTGRTADLPFDIFAYNNAGVVTLEFLNWTNATTRATALVRQDGVWCKTGSLTRRYVGSCRPRSAGTYSILPVAGLGFSGTSARIDLWNVDNRITMYWYIYQGSGTYTYTTATWRQAQGSTSNQIDLMVGLDEDPLTATVQITSSNTNASIGRYVSIGLDSTTNPASAGLGCGPVTGDALVKMKHIHTISVNPTIGRHYFAWLEYSVATGTTVWYLHDATIPGTTTNTMAGTWTC